MQGFEKGTKEGRMRTLYFGKHIKPGGKNFYTTVQIDDRDEAVRYLKQYNERGGGLVGCRKRTLDETSYRELIFDINSGVDTLRRKYFEKII
jgi:hypothetical protein